MVRRIAEKIVHDALVYRWSGLPGDVLNNALEATSGSAAGVKSRWVMYQVPGLGAPAIGWMTALARSRREKTDGRQAGRRDPLTRRTTSA